MDGIVQLVTFLWRGGQAVLGRARAARPLWYNLPEQVCGQDQALYKWADGVLELMVVTVQMMNAMHGKGDRLSWGGPSCGSCGKECGAAR